MTLTVQAPSTAAEILVNTPFSGSRNVTLCLLAMLIVAIAGATANKGWKGSLRVADSLAVSMLVAALLATAGCAGLVSSSSQKSAERTPSLITVTASAANAPTHAVQLTLNVAP